MWSLHSNTISLSTTSTLVGVVLAFGAPVIWPVMEALQGKW